MLSAAIHKEWETVNSLLDDVIDIDEPKEVIIVLHVYILYYNIIKGLVL